MIEFIEWVLLTLGTVCVTLILAERYGAEIAIAIYAALTIIANVIAYKIVLLMNIPCPAGVIVYSSTFLVTDMLCELFGKDYAKKAVISGFIANLIAVISIYIAISWKPAPFMSPEAVEAFNSVLGLAPRVVFASVVAYVVSQTHDVYAYHFWKKITRGKYLWLRNNASTMVSKALDTVLFITIAFYGVYPIFDLIKGQYIVKLVIAILDTPFLYITVLFSKFLMRESIEVSTS